MTLVGIKKGLVRSVIVCQNPDFKRKSIVFLNNSAITGEKFHVESLSEALDMMSRDNMMRNLIVDGSMFKAAEISTLAEQLSRLAQTGSIQVLCYLSEEQADLKENSGGGVLFSILPMSQPVFNRAFCLRRDREQSKDKPKPSPTKQAPALSLIEASAHIKETVELLNQFNQDRNNLPILLKLGQRFNGLAASFLFLKDKPGYFALSQMATVIDEICRHYEREGGEVLVSHWKLIEKSAKCSYLLLKELRTNESKPIKLDELIGETQSLYQQFTDLDDLNRREQLDQDMVDSLLETELKKA